jgi:NADH pyrophosphatase NudC (nudix superfamily)
VIDSVVRELWEESGLVAKKITNLVGKYEWLDRGEIWKKVTFLVDVEHEGNEQPEVKIDPKEQATFLWATEDEVISNKCGDVFLKWTSDDQRRTVLDAFKLRKCYGAGSTVCGKPGPE